MRGIHHPDRHQQQDRARGAHYQDILHDGLAGLEGNCTMDVQTVPAAALFHCDRLIFRRPASNRAHRVRGMHRIGEKHRFIAEYPDQQGLVFLNEGRLLRRVKLG